jgi:hypothetical protein
MELLTPVVVPGIHDQTVTDIATSIRQGVVNLNEDHPDWIPILRAACTVVGRISPDAQFAGSWVLQEYARATGGSTIKPGLRRLVSYGLIESTGVTSRGGKRAYYVMPHREEIERALADLPAEDSR